MAFIQFWKVQLTYLIIWVVWSSQIIETNSKSHIQIIKDIWCHQPGRHNLIGSYEKNQNFESSHHANYFRKYDSHISTTVAAILPSLREQDRDLNQLWTLDLRRWDDPPKNSYQLPCSENTIILKTYFVRGALKPDFGQQFLVSAFCYCGQIFLIFMDVTWNCHRGEGWASITSA